MTIKFRQFQKNHTCLTSCQRTSGAPIGDLIDAFCTHFIIRKSHERTAPNAEQKCFTDSKTELRAILFSRRSGNLTFVHILFSPSIILQVTLG